MGRNLPHMTCILLNLNANPIRSTIYVKIYEGLILGPSAEDTHFYQLVS